MGKALRESTETVREVGASLVNRAREVITSTSTGHHDAVSVLKAQHRNVETLFEKARVAQEPHARRALMNEIARQLEMHTTIEEEIFYPAVRSLGAEDTERLVDEAFEEHHVVDLVLRELPELSPRDGRFVAKMTVLSELVEHHVKEEEQDMFKRAQGLGRERLAELGARLDAAASRHHPRAK